MTADFQYREFAVGASGATGVAAEHRPIRGGDGGGDGPAGDLFLEVAVVEQLAADFEARGGQSVVEELHRLGFTGRVADGVKGEGGLEQRQRRQTGRVRPLQKPAEVVGRLIDAAVVEFGDAQPGEGFGPGVGEVVAAGRLIQQGRVGAGLSQEDLRRPAVLHPVGGQAQGRQGGEQSFRLRPSTAVLDGDLSGWVFHLLFDEEIRPQVEDGLKDLGDGDPVAVAAFGGLDVLRGGLLDLAGHLGVLGEHLGHGRPTDGRRRQGGAGRMTSQHSEAASQHSEAAGLLTQPKVRQDENGKDGERKADDARSGGESGHRRASSGSADPC